MTEASQPLSGIRVLDFSQVMMGPSATQVLGDYGADVIKIERPGTGDLSRTSISGDPDGLENPIYRSLNRNKRSIVLDLRKEEGKAVVYELVKSADVVVNNFRAGVMERMGFGYEALSKLNPRIICAFGSGFGQKGPLSYKGGQDIVAQALSGLMARRSNEEEPVTVYPTSLCDFTTGLHMVQAILLALLQRDRTGKGQEVSVSLFESALSMQMQEAAMWLQRARDFSWGGMPLNGVFKTLDGALVIVGAFKANPLRDICAALAIGDLSVDARFLDNLSMAKNKKLLQGILRDRLVTNSTAHWISKLEEQDLLCAPVLTLAEALSHDQTKHNGSIVDPDGSGTQDILGSPLTMSGGGFKMRYPAPGLGAHGREVLLEAGFAPEEVAGLGDRGVLL